MDGDHFITACVRILCFTNLGGVFWFGLMISAGGFRVSYFGCGEVWRGVT